jgi:D-alanyl-D-alanine carboxypeptidase
MKITSKMNLNFFLAIVVGVFFTFGVFSGVKFFYNFVKAEFYQYSITYGDQSELSDKGAPGPDEETIEDVEGISEESKYTDKSPESFPRLTAQSYLVADLDTGEILYEKNATTTYPIASVTKLMTALVSIESAKDQEKEVFIGYEAVNAYGYQGNLSVGDRISLNDLLYPLLLESSNDAAEALAIHRGREFFLKSMNYRAQTLGMNDTYYRDPSGLSFKNVSTSSDLLKLLQYINENREYIFYVTREKKYAIEGHSWYNTSHFLNDDGYVAGKNGFTDEAQHSLVTVFDLPLVEFDTRRIAIILLKAQATERDTRAVLLHLLQNVYFEAK